MNVRRCCSFCITEHQHLTLARTFIHNLQQLHDGEVPNDNEPNVNGLVSSFATAVCNFCILRRLDVDPMITYLLFTILRRWNAIRRRTQRTHTTHEGSYPARRIKNASLTRYDDIFELREPYARRHLAHRDRKRNIDHAEYITATHYTGNRQQCAANSDKYVKDLHRRLVLTGKLRTSGW